MVVFTGHKARFSTYWIPVTFVVVLSATFLGVYFGWYAPEASINAHLVDATCTVLATGMKEDDCECLRTATNTQLRCTCYIATWDVEFYESSNSNFGTATVADQTSFHGPADAHFVANNDHPVNSTGPCFVHDENASIVRWSAHDIGTLRTWAILSGVALALSVCVCVGICCYSELTLDKTVAEEAAIAALYATPSKDWAGGATSVTTQHRSAVELTL